LRGNLTVHENLKPVILVVDDEPRVLELIRLMLEHEGYSVLVAASGREAIRIACEPEANIDILVTDIIMPHMNGKELANRISMIRPYIKVLFISAYAAEILSHSNLCPEGSDFIRKPFLKEELVNKISRVMESGQKWKDLVSRQA
jgi:two-component system, cell cycle sensor histidine kinase and response regulator CckA